MRLRPDSSTEQPQQQTSLETPQPVHFKNMLSQTFHIVPQSAKNPQQTIIGSGTSKVAFSFINTQPQTTKSQVSKQNL